MHALALQGLREGGKSTDDLSPTPVPAEDRTEAYRSACVDAWREGAKAFEAALAAWPDEGLDGHQAPHPFLGIFSLREWADFTVIHARHHLGVAERRMGRGWAPALRAPRGVGP